MIPGEFIHSFGDVHIYSDHSSVVDEQLKRTPMKLPVLKLNSFVKWEELESTNSFKNLVFEDFKLENYISHPPLKAKLSTGLKK